MSLPKDILPQVTAAELDAFSTIGGEERLIAFVNRFRELERKRIIKNIKSRVGDLRSCHKNDSCQELATLIESYIEEWTEGEQE